MKNHTIKKQIFLSLAFLFITLMWGEEITKFLNFNSNALHKDAFIFIITILIFIYTYYRFLKNKLVKKSLILPILLVVLSYLFITKYDSIEFVPFSFNSNLYYSHFIILNFSLLIIGFVKKNNECLEAKESVISNRDLLNIDHSNEDRLNRDRLIESIFNSLTKYPYQDSKDSFNIAIKGEWSIGKTFIKEKLIEKLNDTKLLSNSTLIKHYQLEFKPWSYNKNNDITDVFFNEIDTILKDKDPHLSKKINQYFLTLTNISNNYIINSIKVLKDLLYPQISKHELGQYLQEKNTLLYIFIDDIDRLEKEEIQELFKFIRNNGSIKHLAYILLFDNEHLKKNLNYNNNNEFSIYLTKFFNLEIEINTGELDYYKLLEEYLIIKINDEPTQNNLRVLFQKLKNIDHSLLKHLFNNVRILKSFCNKILFILEYKRDLIQKNILYPIDIVILEILKFKYSDIYNELSTITYSDPVQINYENASKKYKSANDIKILQTLKDLLFENNDNLNDMLDVPIIERKKDLGRFRNINFTSSYFNDFVNINFNAITINNSLNSESEFINLLNNYWVEDDFTNILFNRTNYASEENCTNAMKYLILSDNYYPLLWNNIFSYLSQYPDTFSGIINDPTIYDNSKFKIQQRILDILFKFNQQFLKDNYRTIELIILSIKDIDKNEIKELLSIYNDYLRLINKSTDEITIKINSLLLKLGNLLDPFDILKYLPIIKKLPGLNTANNLWVIQPFFLHLFLLEDRLYDSLTKKIKPTIYSDDQTRFRINNLVLNKIDEYRSLNNWKELEEFNLITSKDEEFNDTELQRILLDNYNQSHNNS